MKHLTSTILSKLIEEREMNALVSLQLLNETDNWIERFKMYPEIEFDLEGEETSFVTFLNQNQVKIEGFVAMYSALMKNVAPATEEEAGVVEGYIELDEEDYSPVEIMNEAESKKVPFLTLSYEQFEEMFIGMKKIVDSHTEKINHLQDKLESYESAKQIPYENQSVLAEMPPVTIYTQPEQVVELPDTPPTFNYSNKEEDVFEEPVRQHEAVQEELETETESFDEFSVQQPKVEAPVKQKLDKKKKIMLVIIMLAALIVLITTLLLPAKKFSKEEPAQMKPPVSMNAPATLPVMKNVSTVKQTPIETTPAPVIVPISEKPAPIKTEAPKAEIPADSKKEVAKGLSYTENMKTFIKAFNNNTMYLSKDEKVIDIEGQDTDNWILNYKPEKSAIIFYAKGNQLKNTIIIKTNKKTYTLNLTSSNNGYTQINLAN